MRISTLAWQGKYLITAMVLNLDLAFWPLRAANLPTDRCLNRLDIIPKLQAIVRALPIMIVI